MWVHQMEKKIRCESTLLKGRHCSQAPRLPWPVWGGHLFRFCLLHKITRIYRKGAPLSLPLLRIPVTEAQGLSVLFWPKISISSKMVLLLLFSRDE